ncbi:putative bifunctional diguanylate cyclase/phosphodiesterase [Symbioplanes lichenis]|uniref:putative bifunctional diguanylate cyclase/phosphodiesterase n=1 Tax=Symbioplanes lichenis TaxID=1629072 RepID=UPI002739B325|nr:bifunctional diguanylate cyclase/phosphodiesterase [Actinoplanes lichenis]
MTEGGVAARAGTARPWWLWFAGAMAVVVVATPFIRPSGPRNAAELTAAAVVAPALVLGLRLHRPRYRLGWHVLLAAVIYTVVSNVLWPVLTPGADFLYYTTYPLLGVALAVLPVQGRRSLWFAGYTEAGIIAGGAAVVWWTLLVDPLVLDPGRLPDQAHIVVFPMLDVLLFALALRLLLVAGVRSVAYLLIAAMTFALLTADTAFFVSVVAGGGAPMVSQVSWLLSNTLLGTAALHPSMAVAQPAPGDAETLDGVGGTRVYIVTVVATPILTGIYLLHEAMNGGVNAADIVVPVGATALTSALVVTRMRQINQIARRHAVALQESLSRQEELQGELRHQAQHDSLTGLPNREVLYERITAALAAGSTGALIVADLDGFKDINDRFGHAVGDDLLLAVAGRLLELVPDGSVLARLDSDEFAVVVRDADVVACTRLGERFLSATREPFTVQAHELFATVSLGLRELDPELLTGDVLRDAYLALHAAKAAGRDQLTRWTPALTEEKLAVSRTVERLRGAIERDELVVHYQPLIRLADERMTGVEALIRWQPAGGPMIPPDKFIAAAEDSGLIVPIGTWVLHRACEVVAGWQRLGHPLAASVNVSPRQLREPDFAALVLDALRTSGLPPASLILEITEGVLVASGAVTEQAIRHLETLRARGVRVAIDDFGTGYSSLAYLRDLPIDHVKIDKSFMPSGAGDPALRAMVKAIVDLAAGLRLGTIAEGVETAGQAAFLRELGCERAQGYYYSRPVPAADLLTAFQGRKSVF